MTTNVFHALVQCIWKNEFLEAAAAVRHTEIAEGKEALGDPFPSGAYEALSY